MVKYFKFFLFLLLVANNLLSHCQNFNGGLENWFEYERNNVWSSEPEGWFTEYGILVEQNFDYSKIKEGKSAAWFPIQSVGGKFSPCKVQTTFATNTSPRYLSFWSYTENFGSARFEISVTLFQKNGNIVGKATYHPTDEYRYINDSITTITRPYHKDSVFIEYSSNQAPDSCTVQIIPMLTSDYKQSGHFRIDDIQFSKSTASIGDFSPSKNQSIGAIRIVPNPVSNSLHLQIDHLEIGLFNISILNEEGKLINQKYQNLVVGNNKIDIDIDQLISGVYFVGITNGQGLTQTIKFIKQ